MVGGDFIRIKPITLATANAFIKTYHRHHSGAAGYKYAIGLINDIGDLCGVVVVGRPVARHYDDGYTAEVTRMCTDGIRNGCSFLYSAAARTAREMGYINYVMNSWTIPAHTKPPYFRGFLKTCSHIFSSAGNKIRYLTLNFSVSGNRIGKLWYLSIS